MKMLFLMVISFFGLHPAFGSSSWDVEHVDPISSEKVAASNINMISKYIPFSHKKVLEIGACFGFDAKEMTKKGADVFCADIKKNYLSYLKNNHGVQDNRIVFGKIQTDNERVKRELLERHIDLDETGWNEDCKTMNSIPNLVDVLKDETPFDLLTIFRISFCEIDGGEQLSHLVKHGGELVIGYATEGEYEGRLNGGTFDVMKQDFDLKETLFRRELFKEHAQDSIRPDNAVWMIWRKK